MKKATFETVNPVLPCQDVSLAIKFYVERLGFELLFQDVEEAPTYAGVGRDKVELHLQWHDPAEWERVERIMLRLRISDVDKLFKEYQDKEVFHVRTELRDTVWGTREFAFYDPNNNGLTFYKERMKS